jgi:HAD superfamily hydrolase (TIGR01509 family)
LTGRHFDLVIFDCDGVLIDSERIGFRIDARELALLGIEIDPAELSRRYSGVPYPDMYRDLAQRHGISFAADHEARVHELALAACEAELEPTPGIAAALDAITLPVAVASSSNHEWLRRTLTRVGLYHRFAPHVFSATEVARGKPAPDLFLHAAARMGAAPERCLVIEDSVAGTRGAVAAGMTVLGYTGTAYAPSLGEALAAAGAARVYDDHARLRRLLEEIGYLRQS